MKQQIRVSVNVSVSERALDLSEMDKDSSIEARDHRVASHFDGFGFFVVCLCVCQAFVHSSLFFCCCCSPSSPLSRYLSNLTMDDVPRHQSKVTLLRFLDFDESWRK